MHTPVPFIRPIMPDSDELRPYLEAIRKNNWYSNYGPLEQQFCTEVAQYIDSGVGVITVNNATTGLMAALHALVPRGNGTAKIATPSFTFAAASHAIVWHGYQPAWIDIDSETLQPKLESFSKLLETDSNIVAILLTNSFGIGVSDISEWESRAAKLQIPLIIDSASGLGSTYADGTMVGSRGDCEVISFHATKAFAIGEGGAVVSRDPGVLEKVRAFSNFGFAGTREAADLAINGKMQELNAAIGLIQLTKYPEQLLERKRIAAGYLKEFADYPIWAPPDLLASSISFAPFVLNDMTQRNRTLKKLHEQNISVGTYYDPPVHAQKFFKKFGTKVSLSNTELIAEKMIALPVLPVMLEVEFDSVVTAVKESFENQ